MPVNSGSGMRGVGRLALTSAAAMLVIAGLASFPQPAEAQTIADAPEISPLLLQHFGRTTRDRYVESVVKFFRNNARDRSVIDVEHIDREREKAVHRLRTSKLTATLTYDLNADGQLTVSEIREFLITTSPAGKTPADHERHIAQILNPILAQDFNKDGTITFAEMLEYAKSWSEGQKISKLDILHRYVELDTDGDGRLTEVEIEALALQAFDHFDADRNGEIDSDEWATVTAYRQTRTTRNRREAERKQRELRQAHLAEARERVRKRREEKEKADPTRKLQVTQWQDPCQLPPPPDDAGIFLVVGKEGDGLSTASIAGQDDVTTTVRVKIEPGPPPLYLIVRSYSPVIWQIEGATARIARMVVIPENGRHKPGAGVTGVPAGRVSFLPGGACFVQFPANHQQSIDAARAVFRQLLGRPLADIISVDRLSGVVIPPRVDTGEPSTDRVTSQPDRNPDEMRIVQRDGSVVAITSDGRIKQLGPETEDAPDRPPGVSRKLWAAFKKRFPAGTVEIDPADVVATGNVEPYVVLPGEAGLIQLIRSGAVERIDRHFLLLKKPIDHYPAGLSGYDNSVMIGRGVPAPTATPPFGLCVYSEETGRLLTERGSCQRY